MKKFTFKDSRAIKITAEMRGALNKYNEKQAELEKANEELAILEESRKGKNKELESLNIKALDTDKKVAKEASKKIKIIDKEMNKFQNDIQKANDKINKLLEKNKPINMPEVTLKAFKNFEQVDIPEEKINVDMPIIKDDITPEIKVDNSSDNQNNNESVMPIIENQSDDLSEIKLDNEVAKNNDIFKAEITDLPQTVEPVVLDEQADDNNIEVVSEAAEIEPVNDESLESSEVVVNPFLSQEGVDKMWNEIKNVEEPTFEKENTQEDKQDKKETLVPQTGEIEKPDIFGKNSEFARIADKVVSPSPLIPEGSDISLIPFDDYNDYVFKFGQDHYGKEALTPKEISDLSNIEKFLDGDTFEIERSKQYKNIEKENEELKNRICSIDDDYKKQVSDMRKEHFSNLDNLGNLIDQANGIISDNRTKIGNLEDTNKDLNKTIDNQTNEIASLNKTKDELEKTIESLNSNIDELQRIKKEHEEKIKNYEAKFKEVLGIVKEVKTDN